MLPSDIWDDYVSGDFKKFPNLFHGYYSGLYGYGLKLCRDPDLVKDAIQNLFVALWERRYELDHITSPNTYLYVSLRRNILRVQNKQNKKTFINDELKNELQIEFGPEDLVIKSEKIKEQKKELQEALNQLSNRQKEVLYLHYYNGMSFGEIEEILSINRQSVRNHMYRAMETLRAVLDIDIMRLVICICFLFLSF